MADSTQRTSKTVEYKIVGDNTSLINSVTSAIKKLDALDVKLKRIATKKDVSILGEGQTRDALARINSITKATNDLVKVRNILNTINVDALDKSQVALIKTAKTELASLAEGLGKAGQAGTITQEQLNQVTQATRKLQQAFKNAGIQVVDYEALAKQQAADEKKRAKEIEKTLREKARVEKETAKQAKQAEKDRIQAARQAEQEYKQIIRNTINTITSLINVFRNVVRITYQLMDYAADYGETMNKFNVVAGKSTEELDAFVKKMNNVLGLDLKDLYDSVASFKSIANSIKLGTKEATTFSKTLTMLGVDLASLYNTSTEQAINALISGLHGLQRPLKNYDIYLYDSNLEQTALTHGIKKQVTAMNESEKILLRYLSILEQSKDAQGDMSRTISSTANQLRIAKAQFAQLKRSLGQIATVMAFTVIPALNLLMSGITKFFTFIAKSLGYKIEDLSNIFDDNSESVGDDTEALENYSKVAKGLSDLDEINLISDSPSNNLIDPKTGGLAIDPDLLKALDTYDNKMDKVSKTIGEVSDKIAHAFEGTAAAAVFEFLTGAVKVLGEAFNGIVENWDTFEPIIKTLINLLTVLVAVKVAKTIKEWGTSLLGFAKKMHDFNIQLPTMTQNIRGEMVKTKTSVNGATLAFAALTFAMAQAAASAFYDQFEGETKQVVATIGLIVSALTTAAVAWMAYHGTMSWGTAVPIISAAIGAGIASIQAMIPQMATGGVVDQPTVAMIGEGRYNEAVVPLGNSPQFAEMKEDIASAVLRKIGPTPTYQAVQPSGGQTPVVIQLNGRDLARVMLPYIGYTQPQTGVKLV